MGLRAQIGDCIAELALEHRSAIILEDLDKLRNDGKKSRRFNKKLGLRLYCRIRFCVEYEA